MTSDHVKRRHEFKLKRLNSEIISSPPGIDRKIRVVVNCYDQRDFSDSAPRSFGSSFFHLSRLSSDLPEYFSQPLLSLFTRCCASRRLLNNLFSPCPLFWPDVFFFYPMITCVCVCLRCAFVCFLLSDSPGIVRAVRGGGGRTLSVCS